MATPTTGQVGMPVEVVFDGTNFPSPEPLVDSTDAGEPVKYVPTPGAADDA